MNIIDSLFVVLGLDTSGFKKSNKEVQDGLEQTADSAEGAQGRIDEATKKTDEQRRKAAEEEKKRQREQEAANKKLEEGYKKIRDSIIDIAAAVVAAVAGKEFVHYITETDTATAKLAANTGNTTKNVLALRSAFESIGGSGDEAASTLGNITKILEDLKFKGTFDGMIGFQRAGFDVGKFVGAKDDMERLKMMATAIQGMSAQDAQYFGQQAHFSEETINLIRQGGEEFDKAISRGREWNKMSGEDKKATQERNQAYAQLHATFDSLGRGIMTQLTPAFVAIEKAASWLFETLSKNATVAIGLLGGIGSAIALIKGYSLASWGAATGGAFGAVATAAGTLLGRLGLVLAVLTSIYEIWKLGKGLWDWYEASHRDEMHLAPGAGGRLAQDRSDPFHSGGTGGSMPAGLSAMIDSAAQAHNVDPNLLRALVMQESSGNANAIGPMTRYGQAKGLTQLIDGTAASHGVTNPFDPMQNLNGGAAYLREMLDRYGGNTSMALAAYNWGPGNLDKNGMGNLPGETSAYVASINARMNSHYGSGGGGTTINVGPVSVQTSASKMEGAGQDIGKGINSRLLIAGQSNGNGY